jgi:hypothetical protein
MLNVRTSTAEIHQGDGYVSFVPTTEITVGIGACAALLRLICKLEPCVHRSSVLERLPFARYPVS